MKNEWIDGYLTDSPMETEIMGIIDAENKAFNELPTTIAHNANYKRLITLWSKLRKERISAAREKHFNEDRRQRKLSEDERKANRELRIKKNEEEFNAMPQEYKDAVNAYKKLDDDLKRRFRFVTYDICEKEPVFEEPKTTEEDIKDLQDILVQDVIDFLNARGLQEVDTVSFHVDGLKKSLEEERWTPSSDSSIYFYGIDEDGRRATIGSYM